MNYLAHVFLAGENPETITGNFIADHVKGAAINAYSDGIKEGIFHHRAIDRYTDEHKSIKDSILLIKPELGRYTPVAIDMYYDHFLARNWDSFSSINRLQFTQIIYAALNPFYEKFPIFSQRTYDYMTSKNWLYNYADLDFLERCFQGLDRRASFDTHLTDAVSVLKKHYSQLESNFMGFMPDVIQHCKR